MELESQSTLEMHTNTIEPHDPSHREPIPGICTCCKDPIQQLYRFYDYTAERNSMEVCLKCFNKIWGPAL